MVVQVVWAVWAEGQGGGRLGGPQSSGGTPGVMYPGKEVHSQAPGGEVNESAGP